MFEKLGFGCCLFVYLLMLRIEFRLTHAREAPYHQVVPRPPPVLGFMKCI